jgi:MYXO-CTERM domain-containing protein
MRKTLSALGLAAFLTLVPAAVATAEAPVAAVSQSQVTPAPQQSDDGGGNSGLWGLLGLLGLLGLAGMRKMGRGDHLDTHTRTTHQPRP